jgi:predicted alpha/beta superfamily hydrolase
MAEWQDYLEGKNPAEHTISGRVCVWRNVHSPQLNNQRDVMVYLPPSHGQSDQRYPVIYMHDGQNLFDAATSFAGEWQVDEAMETLAAEGCEAIVVAISNLGPRRVHEYSPFRHFKMGGGQGEKYADFITETLKPIIDADFQTLTGRGYTGIVGSSLGGLISTFAFFHRPDIFGFMGALSPAYWFAGKAIYPFIQEQPYAGGRIYLDVGTAEMGQSRGSGYFRQNAREVAELLARKGYRYNDDLLFIVEEGAAHTESAWAQRIPNALRFLLNGTVPTQNLNTERETA